MITFGPFLLFAFYRFRPLSFLNFFTAVSRRERRNAGLTFNFPYAIENGAGRALTSAQTR
jgi:hypothetical protein